MDNYLLGRNHEETDEKRNCKVDEIPNYNITDSLNFIDSEDEEAKNNRDLFYHEERKCSLSVTFPKDEDEISTNEGVKFLGLDDDDSICSIKETSNHGPEIPDGGWGWVVVAASFLIATVADGLAFSYGLVHEKFVSHFETSEAKTSLIGSLFISVPLIAGPIMSALVDRYGCRSMTIVGSIASTIGFIAASFSNSVEVLYVTYGLMAGLGMGLLYVTAVVCIAYWFEKRRNLAVGLGSCGMGFGTFLYSPLTTYLLDEFGWRGALVFLAGTVLNVCICGAVMRDPEWLIMEQKKQRELNRSRKSSSCVSISAKSGGGDTLYLGAEELKSLVNSGENPDNILTTLIASITAAESLEATTKMNTNLENQKVNSVISLPTFLKQNEKVPPEVLTQLAANERLYNIILQNYPSLLALKSISDHTLPVEPVPETPKNNQNKLSMKFKLNKKVKDDKDFETKLNVVKSNLLKPKASQIKPDRKVWLSKKFSDHCYLRELRVHRNSMMHRGAMMNIAKYRLRASSCPNIYKNSMWSVTEDLDERTWIQRILYSLNKTFDFNMFTEFHFLMMNLSILILFIWFIVPYFYISNFMVMSGYRDTEGSMMLSIFGAATIIGIVGLGWMGDLPWVNVTKTYAVCLIGCGISIIMFPVLIRIMDPKEPYSFYIMAINAAIFGLMFSSSYSYTPSILVELIALERFTTAYGLVLLSQGIGHLIGPPIAGTLRDNTGYWDSAFYVAGVWVIVSGFFVGVIPYTKNFRIFGSAPLTKDAAVEPESDIKIIVN